MTTFCSQTLTGCESPLATDVIASIARPSAWGGSVKFRLQFMVGFLELRGLVVGRKTEC